MAVAKSEIIVVCFGIASMFILYFYGRTKPNLTWQTCIFLPSVIFLNISWKLNRYHKGKMKAATTEVGQQVINPEK